MKSLCIVWVFVIKGKILSELRHSVGHIYMLCFYVYIKNNK